MPFLPWISGDEPIRRQVGEPLLFLLESDGLGKKNYSGNQASRQMRGQREKEKPTKKKKKNTETKTLVLGLENPIIRRKDGTGRGQDGTSGEGRGGGLDLSYRARGSICRKNSREHGWKAKKREYRVEMVGKKL